MLHPVEFTVVVHWGISINLRGDTYDLRRMWSQVAQTPSGWLGTQDKVTTCDGECRQNEKSHLTYSKKNKEVNSACRSLSDIIGEYLKKAEKIRKNSKEYK